MKRLNIFLCMLLVFGLLVGCADFKEDGEENRNRDSKTEKQTLKKKEGVIEINLPIADDDIVQATLIEIKKDKDVLFGNTIEVKFEVVNKTDKTIEVQARQVSIDGKMVDESTIFMSQEIAPGKSADAVMTILEFDDIELPAMEENLEMLLHVFSWDDFFDSNYDYPVKVEF